MQDVRALITSLAQLPEGPPIVTLYLDAHWRDEQQRERVRLFFHERAKEARELFAGDQPDQQGVLLTLGRLERFVDELVNQVVHEDSRGVMVAASEPRGLFEEVLIDQPFEPAMFIDSRPRLYPLIEAFALEQPAFLVTVDATGATILEQRAGELVDEQDVQRQVPHYHRAGGWSQRRIQQRTKLHIQLVWQECVALLATLVRADGPGAVVLFGQDGNLRNFAKELPAWLRANVVAMLPSPRERREMLEVARGALDEERVAREFLTIHHILRQGLSERSGTVGVEDTLLAMNERRVKVLALTRRFDARGYRCSNCDALWATGGLGCVFCGAPTSLVSLREELVRRAVQQGADIVVTPEASPLNTYRGIGALLRHLTGDEHRRMVRGEGPVVSPEEAPTLAP